MEEMLECKVLQPIKVGGMIVTQGRIELPAAIAHEESAAGRVEILEGGFTPVEPQGGIAEIQGDGTDEALSPIDSQNSPPEAGANAADLDQENPGEAAAPAAAAVAPQRKPKGR